MSDQTNAPVKVWDADTIQGAEKFLDVLKLEQDRLTNKLKVGEDRARANATAALAVIGVLTFLRGLPKEPPAWTLYIALGLVLVVLITTVAIVFNRKTSNFTPDELRKEQKALYDQGRTYMYILLNYHQSWIDNIAELHRLQAQKFLLLDIQNISLGLLLLLVTGLLIWSAAP